MTVLDEQSYARVLAVLDGLLQAGQLKAVLLFDKRGECIASRGDEECMSAVAETHFKAGLDLRHLCRDAHGSTVLSEASTDVVRLEAVAGRYILTLVCADPLLGRSLRDGIDGAKKALEHVLGAPGPAKA